MPSNSQSNDAPANSEQTPSPAVDPALRSTARTGVLFAITAIGVLGCLALVGSFIPAVTWSVALAVATRTPFRWLRNRIGKPAIAAAISVFLVLLLLVGPVLLLLYSIGSQLLDLVSLVRSGAPQQWAAQMLTTYPHINAALTHVRGVVSLKEASQAAAGFLAGQLQAILAGSVRTITQAAITLFTLFFLYKDGDKFQAAFRSVLPVSGERADFLLHRMSETISSSLQGSVLIAAIQGSLGGLMFWALSVPQAFLWAFLMGMLALIPSLGTFMIWMPVTIYLALSGHLIKASIMLAWGMGVISTVDNVLYPSLVGNRLKLHTVPIFFSVLGGIALFGISGLVLGPLLLTTTIALLHLWNPAILPLGSGDKD